MTKVKNEPIDQLLTFEETAMKQVYILMHETQRGECEDVKMIGAFSTEQQAISARDSLLGVQGFRNHREGFTIDTYPLDEINWTEGFVDDD